MLRSRQISIFVRSHLSTVHFCAKQCERFHKGKNLYLRFCTKTEQCERGMKQSFTYSFPFVYHDLSLKASHIIRIIVNFLNVGMVLAFST